MPASSNSLSHRPAKRRATRKRSNASVSRARPSLAPRADRLARAAAAVHVRRDTESGACPRPSTHHGRRNVRGAGRARCARFRDPARSDARMRPDRHRDRLLSRSAERGRRPRGKGRRNASRCHPAGISSALSVSERRSLTLRSPTGQGGRGGLAMLYCPALWSETTMSEDPVHYDADRHAELRAGSYGQAPCVAPIRRPRHPPTDARGSALVAAPGALDTAGCRAASRRRCRPRVRHPPGRILVQPS